MIPKIFFKSCQKDEPSLIAWERFFKNNKILYKTDRFFKSVFFNKSNIGIFFGSWKPYKTSFHKCKNRVVNSYENFIVNETSLLGREKITEAFQENWYRIGLNGFLSNTGKFNNHQMPSDRWEMIREKRGIEFLPWNFDGSYVLVCLQLPGDASLQGADISQWMFDICSQIRKKCDFPILIRTPQLKRNFDQLLLNKTLELKNVSLQNGTRENLLETLDNSLFVCTFSSGIGIDALMRGKPVVVSSKASFVYDSRTKLNDAVEFNYNKTNRLNTFSNLAYCQWSLEEIELGLPWNHLLNLIY